MFEDTEEARKEVVEISGEKFRFNDNRTFSLFKYTL